MAEQMKSLEAGKYTLVARFREGAWRGAMWSGGKIIRTIEANSLKDAWEQLGLLLHEELKQQAAMRRGVEPTAAEACNAFLRIASKLPASYKRMLRAHLRAPEQRITTAQLAQAAGYGGYGAANLHYGLLGAMMYAEIPDELPTDPRTGRPVMTFTLATGDRDSARGEDYWVWKMRPHIAEGVRLAQIL